MGKHGRLEGMASVPENSSPRDSASSGAARPQVRPKAEGWNQALDADGRPALQFAQSKRVQQPPTHLADLTLEERIAKAKEMGISGFRAKQLSVHYFRHYTADPAQMTDLPAETREQLVGEFLPPLLTEVRRLRTDDGRTIKFLWRLFDGALVESVLMRYRNRITLCISSQCGCGMNCPFCATGQNGLTRNMSAAEIVDQIVQANRVIAAGELDGRESGDGARPADASEATGGGTALKPDDEPGAPEGAEEDDHTGLGEEADFAAEDVDLPGQSSVKRGQSQAGAASPAYSGVGRVSNIVFMGMGEPLANYKRVMSAVRRMVDPAPEGLGMSARGITISTVGLVPAIRKLAAEELPITFALSLHAPDDKLRDELIPVNSRWKADEAIDAAYEYYEKTGRRVSIEYALIKDMNDHPWRADLLAEKLNARGRGWVHVNPIPLNPTPNSVWTSSEPEVMQEFLDRLNAAGVPTTLRDTRGKEIDGACGQLAAAEE